MKYYRYDPDADNFAGIGFEWEIDAPERKRVLGVHDIDQPLIGDWTPPNAHVFEDNPPTEGDFPSLSNFNAIPIMSQRAWDTLQPLIGYCCEALPIVYPSRRVYYIIHVMETIDALDEDRSELRRSQIDGRVNRVFKYTLMDQLLAEKHIFKLPLKSGGELIVNDVFRKAVEMHGLLGLHFVPVLKAS